MPSETSRPQAEIRTIIIRRQHLRVAIRKCAGHRWLIGPAHPLPFFGPRPVGDKNARSVGLPAGRCAWRLLGWWACPTVCLSIPKSLPEADPGQHGNGGTYGPRKPFSVSEDSHAPSLSGPGPYGEDRRRNLRGKGAHAARASARVRPYRASGQRARRSSKLLGGWLSIRMIMSGQRCCVRRAWSSSENWETRRALRTPCIT
jgi:hypothetical protein